MDMDTLRQRLTVRRLVLGISQDALAERMGSSQSYVSRLELGAIKDPSFTALTRWCTALDLVLTISLEDPWDTTCDPEKGAA
jgi:transcriptional regulator with XRE-family HTH domain